MFYYIFSVQANRLELYSMQCIYCTLQAGGRFNAVLFQPCFEKMLNPHVSIYSKLG